MQVRRKLPLQIVVPILALLVLTTPVCADDTIVLQGYTISFLRVDYDSIADQSTWFYHVSGSQSNIGSMYKDLSNLQIELCVSPQQFLLGASHDGYQEHDSVKYEQLNVNKEDPDGVDIWFTIKGRWQAEPEASTVSLKAGKTTYSGKITGPQCSRSCNVTWSMNTRKDWRLLKPGMYISKTMIIELDGQVPVRIDFLDFTPMTNPEESDLTPIKVEYSIGDTLEDADLYGWYPAGALYPDGFNGAYLDIPADKVRKDMPITVWSRLTLTAFSAPRNYIGTGIVTITPICGTHNH